MKMEDIEKQVAEATARSKEFTIQLVDIHQHIKRAKKNKKTLKAAMKEVETRILHLLDARIITIYQSVDNGKEITATFKSGIRG